MSFPIYGNSLHVAPCVRGFYYTVSLVPVLYQHGHIQTVPLNWWGTRSINSYRHMHRVNSKFSEPLSESSCLYTCARFLTRIERFVDMYPHLASPYCEEDLTKLLGFGGIDSLSSRQYRCTQSDRFLLNIVKCRSESVQRIEMNQLLEHPPWGHCPTATASRQHVLDCLQ